MARKRKPLVANGVTVELDAPGLTVIERSNGEVHQYWRVSEEARARGYLPRTVRLYYDLATMAGRLELERRCKLLTNEMLAWLGDPEGQKKPVYDGTMAALIRCYRTELALSRFSSEYGSRLRRLVPNPRARDWSAACRPPERARYSRLFSFPYGAGCTWWGPAGAAR
jgi:hypothetical protein